MLPKTLRSQSLYLILILMVLLPGNGRTEPDLRSKIGQMIMVGFSGTSIPDSLSYDIEYRNLGGIVTLANNLENPSQIQALTESLQQTAGTPLFIAVDEEGGVVARLDEQNGFSSTYTAWQLGTTFNSETQTRNQAAKMAAWLKSTGLNLNLAPVVDVNVNPNSPAIGAHGRSFSSDPETVARHAAWFIDEFRQLDIISTLKHFPGHGSAADDSHLGFTDISSTWSEAELIPYEELLDKGYTDMIMSGHLFNAGIDSLYPATLSSLTINGLLRDSLGFQGVVISDAMYMRAIRDNYAFDEAIELALNAGVDILLYTTNLRDGRSLAGTIIDIVVAKVADGLIDEEVINAAYERIMTLKSRWLIPEAARDDRVQVSAGRLQACPNPFNTTTRLVVDLPQEGHARLELFDIRGQRVQIILDDQTAAGRYGFQLEAGSLSSGIYFLRLETAGIHSTLKLSLLK